MDTEHNDNIDFFPDNREYILDEDQKQSCESILNIDECGFALKQMNNGKITRV